MGLSQTGIPPVFERQNQDESQRNRNRLGKQEKAQAKDRKRRQRDRPSKPEQARTRKSDMKAEEGRKVGGKEKGNQTMGKNLDIQRYLVSSQVELVHFNLHLSGLDRG